MNSIPGSIYKVELDNSHPLAFGYPDYYYTLKQDDNIYEFLKEGGWNVGVMKKDAQVAGFVGTKLKEKLKDGLLLVYRIWAEEVFILPIIQCSEVFGKTVSCYFVTPYLWLDSDNNNLSNENSMYNLT